LGCEREIQLVESNLDSDFLRDFAEKWFLLPIVDPEGEPLLTHALITCLAKNWAIVLQLHYLWSFENGKCLKVKFEH